MNELYILFLLLIWILHPGIIELNVEPYDEDQGTGDLRYVQVSKTYKFSEETFRLVR